MRLKEVTSIEIATKLKTMETFEKPLLRELIELEVQRTVHLLFEHWLCQRLDLPQKRSYIQRQRNRN